MFQEIENNFKSLLAYIESAYHISDEKLLQQRETLLQQEGVLSQLPYIESTPKYLQGQRFAELNISPEARNGFIALSKSKLLFDPPYRHQSQALESVLTDRKSIIVTTGTGSGKTECFLLPILGRLLQEAPIPSFKRRAVRALILYPMNALVNDQLGRLRRLFGHQACLNLFKKAAGRPAKFGRYTGRTLYPGFVDPSEEKYGSIVGGKLAGLRFFADLAEKALGSANGDVPPDPEALSVIVKLNEKGKFPAKSSGSGNPKEIAAGFLAWFGATKSPWLDENRRPIRAVERPDDAELLIRSEMQNSPPDILITNYSMLEYMLLRPIERNIFSMTKEFFENNPQERFLLVLDESHLYTGAQGTEVAMLVRRLKHRLHLKPDQFQVICTSASFGNAEKASEFAADLAGVDPGSMIAITSDDNKLTRTPSGKGTIEEAEWLSGIRLEEVRKDNSSLSEIGEKLQKLPVFGRLANLTCLAKCPDDQATTENEMGPQSIHALAPKLFEDAAQELAKLATDRLVELLSMAKDSNGDPLFAARVHRFYRGLSGLWACADPNCSALQDSQRNEITGKLFVRPRRYCECGHRCFELHSCKKCGTSFFQAWTNDISNPRYLWMENVGRVDGVDGAVQPLHIVLQEPNDYVQKASIRKSVKKPTAKNPEKYRERYMNVITGVLSDSPVEHKTRPVWIPNADHRKENKGLFTTCPTCGAKEWNIGAHKTRGDRPFQHLIASQLLEQPGQSNSTTPLRGRKVLIFSDGRQAASRLAGNLTKDSLRDAIRPLLLTGYRYLRKRFNDPETQSLEYAYPAVLAGAFEQEILLSPIQIGNEHFREHHRAVTKSLKVGNITWNTFRKNTSSFVPPDSLLTAIYETLLNEVSCYHALGLARIVPDFDILNIDQWNKLPVPEHIKSNEADAWKRNLLDLWLQLMMDNRAVLIQSTPGNWLDNPDKDYPQRNRERFIEVFEHILQDKSFVKKHFSETRNNPAIWYKYFQEDWGCNPTVNGFYVDGNKLRFETDTKPESLRCNVCTRIFPFNALVERDCPYCKSSNCVEKIDVVDMLSSSKRVRVYRAATDDMLQTGRKPYPFIAEEHSAAVGILQQGANEAFTRAEEYEIRFQDIELPGDGDHLPVDVLSCTTTMEVGIDIGSLTAVAMRNVPPNRSNYQQRAGRAGRRGSSLATINTYADQDSHNQRYFSDPAAMIGGPVKNPILNIANQEIVLRHAYSLILSMFQQERIRQNGDANVFSTLGTVIDFRTGGSDIFSYRGLDDWLSNEREAVFTALKTILAGIDVFDDEWIQSIPRKLLDALRLRGLGTLEADQELEDASTDSPKKTVKDHELGDAASPENENAPLDVEKLLDRLFSESLLPSYAFPTDVVSMYVFNNERSRKNWPALRYSPQLGLTQALSAYAPGKEVYIDGKRHYSFALWAPRPRKTDEDKREVAWNERKLYYECSRCGYVELRPLENGNEGETLKCKGCEGTSFGPARLWMIPPGFAQPQDIKAELPESDMPEDSFATHAKLMADIVGTEHYFSNERFTFWSGKERLTLTNRGVNSEEVSGFNYCEWCGRIEPHGWQSDKKFSGKQHENPDPSKYDPRKPDSKWCNKIHPARVVLGTQFNTDVVLIRMRFPENVRLMPGTHLARIVLGTLATAMSQTAVQMLEIEPSNIGGEFRPATTDAGRNGLEGDVFLYDNVSDGAGFIQEATKDPALFLKNVLQRLECDCEHACPRCLQNYQNRYLHGDLDRQAASGLLRLLLHGTPPKLDDSVETRLSRILAEDLNDQGIEAKSEQGTIMIAGRKVAVFVSHALKHELPATVRSVSRKETLEREGWKTMFVPHLTIDRALPAATQWITKAIHTNGIER